MIDSTVDLPQPEWPRMATNSPALDRGVDVLDGDERARGRRKDLGQAGQLERNGHRVSSATASERCSRARCTARAVTRRAGVRAAAATPSASPRRARARASPARRAPAAPALRGRGSSTGIGAPSVAGGPGMIGTIRSDSRIASSTLLVIITVVTGRSADGHSAPAPAAASRASARRARRTARPGTARRGSVANARAMRDALPHAARQLARPPVERVAEADPLERLRRARRAARRVVSSGNAASTASRTFSSAREPRQQRVVLEDERRVAADAASPARRRS